MSQYVAHERATAEKEERPDDPTHRAQEHGARDDHSGVEVLQQQDPKKVAFARRGCGERLRGHREDRGDLSVHGRICPEPAVPIAHPAASSSVRRPP